MSELNVNNEVCDMAKIYTQRQLVLIRPVEILTISYFGMKKVTSKFHLILTRDLIKKLITLILTMNLKAIDLHGFFYHSSL